LPASDAGSVRRLRFILLSLLNPSLVVDQTSEFFSHWFHPSLSFLQLWRPVLPLEVEAFLYERGLQ
jgi:hypothetical protein